MDLNKCEEPLATDQELYWKPVGLLYQLPYMAKLETTYTRNYI